MIHLTWNKYSNGVWCSLMDLDLNQEHFNNMEGVYIIWLGGNDGKVVRVGQGIIKNRLKEHRENPEITKYKNQGLFVTWASVASEYRDGIEKYLADKYNPIVGERFPDRKAIEVNLP